MIFSILSDSPYILYGESLMREKLKFEFHLFKVSPQIRNIRYTKYTAFVVIFVFRSISFTIQLHLQQEVLRMQEHKNL